jgi:hypothetical protein
MWQGAHKKLTSYLGKEKPIKRTCLPVLFSISLFATLAAPAVAQTAITEQEAHAIGVQA